MIDDRALYRLAGFAAVAGGLLRIGTSFLVWDSTLVWQEALADGIDVLLLFGFMGIYLARRTALGWAGLAAFVLAAPGITIRFSHRMEKHWLSWLEGKPVISERYSFWQQRAVNHGN